jgi:hypothetical protein
MKGGGTKRLSLTEEVANLCQEIVIVPSIRSSADEMGLGGMMFGFVTDLTQVPLFRRLGLDAQPLHAIGWRDG